MSRGRVAQVRLEGVRSRARFEHLIARCADETPDAVALVSSRGQISYGELARRVDALAVELQRRGVGAEVRVAVCCKRSPELVIALLAILRAGGAFVALDPAAPRQRQRALLHIAKPHLVLTRKRWASILPDNLPILFLEQSSTTSVPEAEVAVASQQLAYVVFTSGSTGKPKGVLGTYGAASAHLDFLVERHLSADDVTLQLARPTQDAVIRDLLAPLAAGARVILPDPGTAADAGFLLDLMARQRVEILPSVVPSWLVVLVEAASERTVELPVLRHILLAGERLMKELCQATIKALGAQLTLINQYGPTEATCTATTFEVRGDGEIPIGRTNPGVVAELLGRDDRPVAAGERGEIFLGGDLLTRGYDAQPALTAAAFAPSRITQGRPGARLYRTGDFGRLRNDGELEFLGRRDHQLKVRGFRVEPQEIESVLTTHPGVRAAVVVGYEREDEVRLVACFVGRGKAPPADELRAFVGNHLPAHFMPTVFVGLDELPTTASRKIDRAAVTRFLDGRHVNHRSADPAPDDSPEAQLEAIWREVLGVEAVNPDDDFFVLGGHSLLATRVASRVWRTFRRHLPVRDLFEQPTFAEQAELLRKLVRGASPRLPELRRRGNDRELPLSFAQQRLWFLHRLEPTSPAYNMPAAFRLSGPLDRAALQGALIATIQRHEALRTCFPSRGGKPVQQIAAVPDWQLAEVDLERLPAASRYAEEKRLAAVEAGRPFDLATGPLIRGVLVRGTDRRHLLLLTIHHTVCDEWSRGVLHEDLRGLYGALALGRHRPLPDLPVQYADFAIWQRQLLTGDYLQSLLTYWRRALGQGQPSSSLPTDRPRPAVQTYGAAAVPWRLSATLVEALEELARSHAASLYMMLLAGWMAWIHRVTGEHDVIVGTPVANRTHQLTEGLIGFFVNMLAMRGDMAPEDGRSPNFGNVLTLLRDTALDAYAHQDLPFERLVEDLAPERDLGHHPVFQITLALQNVPGAPLTLPGLDVQALEPEERTVRFDLELHAWQAETQKGSGGIRGVAIFNRDLFDATTVQRWMRQLETLLMDIAASPARRLDELSVTSRAQRHQALIEWNDAAPGPPKPSIAGRIVALAEASPEALAAVCDDEWLSYGELNRRARALSERLRAAGVGAEKRVAVQVERGLDQVIALLAVWTAGGAYLPIDLALPEARRRLLLRDAEATVLLTSAERRISIETLAVAPAEGSASALSRDVAAYVLYTSGSTGRPKGVVVSQRSLEERLAWGDEAYPLATDDHVLQQAAPGFDFSLWELVAPLLAGARVVLLRRGDHRDPRRLSRIIAEPRISVLHTVPTLLDLLLREDALASPYPRLVLCGGEALGRELAERFFTGSGATLCNQYGPTEATIDVSFHEVEGHWGPATVPIGRPMGENRLLLLEANGNLQIPGCAAELFIAGPALARGYLDRRRETAEVFVPDATGPVGQRLYRSGDRARYLADGRIEFLGRGDHQVKVRGFRIELGEIETALSGLADVERAVVLLRREGATPSLHASLVLDEAEVADEPTGDDLERLEQWRMVHDETYSRSRPEADRDFDIVGWDSSTTGQAIPAGEMRQWVEATVRRVRDVEPRRVLEIGCGTGLLLFRLAPDCERYVATDFSPVVVESLRRRLASAPIPQVELEQREATDFADLRDGEVDTVVLSSVVQYFPSMDYLVEVIHGALRVTADGGSIVLADVRSLPLLEAFCATVELERGAGDMTLAELRQRIRQRLVRQDELVVDPAFFTAWAAGERRIAEVRVQPRLGRARNEMSLFRYDVLLRVGPACGRAAVGAVRRGPDVTLEKLRRDLEEQPEVVTLDGVTDPRLIQPLALVAGLAAASSGGNARVSQLDLDVPAAGIEPDDLQDLADELGYTLELGGLDQAVPGTYQAGTYQATFRRGAKAPTVARASDSLLRSWRDYGNDPLRSAREQRQLEHVKSRLRDELPEHMIPDTWQVLDELPLLPSGKVDRGALTRLETVGTDAADAVGDAGEPRTDVEKALAEVWARVLNRASVGRRADFFELGGHSLLATQVVSRARQIWNLEMPLRWLFEHPVLADLAVQIEAALRAPALADPPPLVRVQRQREMPLSFAQRRLWFLEQLDAGNPALHMPSAVEISGRLDSVALRFALADLVARHEMLRAGFGDSSGRPYQSFLATAGCPLWHIDLSSVDFAEAQASVLFDRVARLPFDLRRGPLLRAVLLSLAPKRAVLILVLHHIAADGWSRWILNRELSELYAARLTGRAASLTPVRLQYADFAAWQRRWMSGATLDAALAYWRQQLAAPIPRLRLPTDRPRPTVPVHRASAVDVRMGKELTAALEGLARDAGASLYMTLLSTFMVLLHKLLGEDDLVVGTPVANRQREECEGVVGCFVNSLAMRAELKPGERFSKILAQLRETVLSGLAHQDLPFEKLVEDIQPDRDTARHPIYQIVFALQNIPRHALELSATECKPVALGWRALTVELEVLAHRVREHLEVEMVFQTALFDATTVSRWARGWRQLLTGVAKDPQRGLDELSPLSSAERHQLQREWGGGRRALGDPHRPRLLHELIEHHAQHTPDAVAVVFSPEEGSLEDSSSLGRGFEEWLSYRQLDVKAQVVAQHLAGLGVGPETVVALFFERSLDVVVAMLATLKAGAAYLPLSPQDPTQRSLRLLEDSQARVLLTGDDSTNLPAPAGVLRSSLRELSLRGARTPRRAHDDNPAYLLYTSGSRGRPKGVPVSHRGVLRYLRGVDELAGLHRGRGAPVHSSLSFDLTVTSLWLPLATGQTVWMLPQDRDVGALLRVLERGHLFRLVKLTPTHLEVLNHRLASEGRNVAQGTAALVIGGESLRGDSLAAWRREDPETQLINHYGPTEAVVGCITHHVRPDVETGEVPIGGALADVEVALLDRLGSPVAMGIPGQIHLAARGLARGYLRRPCLTAERFTPSARPSRPGERLYATGDLARFNVGGRLIFLGRVDDQVKIRGHRIEPGEIESALMGLAGIREAVVVVHEEPQVGIRLVAYLTCRPDLEPAPAELRTMLREHLSEVMIPAVFVILESFPLLPHGKVDRQALPIPATVRSDVDFEAPSTDDERALAEIWGQVLGREAVGVRDNFFDLGGHSLLATQIVSRIRAGLGRELSLRTLFEHPTIAELGLWLGKRGDSSAHEPPHAAGHQKTALVTPPDSTAVEGPALTAFFAEELEEGRI